MTVLALLLALPVCWADRTEPLRAERLALIAHAVEAQPRRLWPRLIATAWYESRMCRAVHSGARRGGSGEGLWQLEPGSHLPRPYSGLTAEATDAAAASAARILERSGQCGPSDADVLTAYAGRRCGSDWPTLRGRVNLVAWARQRLVASEYP